MQEQTTADRSRPPLDRRRTPWPSLRVLDVTVALAVCTMAALAAPPSPVDAQAREPGAPDTAADARLLQAIDLYTGTAGRVDDDEARALLLDNARDTTDPLAQMWIARVLSRGRMGFERDEARAREIADGVIGRIRDLAATGDVEAIFLMGTANDEGLGAGADAAEAARWYRRAAARHHVLGAHNLGNLYLAGRGVEQNDSEAVIWWLRAARTGDAITQLRLGESYEQGRGLTADLQMAAEWYRRAAALGNAQARANLERLGR